MLVPPFLKCIYFEVYIHAYVFLVVATLNLIVFVPTYILLLFPCCFLLSLAASVLFVSACFCLCCLCGRFFAVVFVRVLAFSFLRRARAGAAGAIGRALAEAPPGQLQARSPAQHRLQHRRVCQEPGKQPTKRARPRLSEAYANLRTYMHARTYICRGVEFRVKFCRCLRQVAILGAPEGNTFEGCRVVCTIICTEMVILRRVYGWCRATKCRQALGEFVDKDRLMYLYKGD